MSRRVRDLVGAVSALVVLLVVLMATNDRLRQSVGRLPGDLDGIRSSGPASAFEEAAVGILGVVRDFSADNTFLFTFLVAGVLLVVLMLRS